LHQDQIPVQPENNSSLNRLNILGQSLTELPMSFSSKPISGSITGFEAYSKNGLSVRLLASKDSSNLAIINIQALFSSSGSYGVISNLQFQAAVPKSQRLQIDSATSNTVQLNTVKKLFM
jgi:AP-1 complex subunit gamma-1